MLKEAIAPQLETTEESHSQKAEKPVRPAWWGEDHWNNYTGQCRQVVEAFVEGRFKGKVTTLSYQGKSTHTYTVKNDGTELWLFKNNPSVKINVCVARKLGDFFVGNSSALMAMRQAPRKGKSIGKLSWSGGAQKIQEVLSEVMPMVPFRMFKETGLDMKDMTIIEKAPDEMIDVGRKELQHYTGALLFKIGVQLRSQGVQGKSEEYFLFDIDRNDLARKNFNAFLSKLAYPCKSIKEAYDRLKPQEVIDAERFMKEPCPRQGEWFFIPVPGKFEKALEPRLGRFSSGVGSFEKEDKPYQRAILEAKGNRAHYVQYMCAEGYVTGKVDHGGREHLPITLKGWHKAVPNTATASFKISGSVD